jgi:4-aminobutyrate aminotransferase-like enzyme
VRSDWQSAVRIAPPLTVSQDELDSGLAIMDQAFADSLAGSA